MKKGMKKSVPEELKDKYETQDLSELSRKPSGHATQKIKKLNKEESKRWKKACQDYKITKTNKKQ